jgi:hypothetical protein
MEIGIRVVGRWVAPARRPLIPLLASLLLVGLLGCGTRHSEQSSAGAPADDGSAAGTTVVATAEEPAPRLSRPGRAGRVHQVTLSDRRCIRFDPQWTNVRVGESVSWHSDLGKTVRIYISPGVFAKESYLVRPGATVNTGPALAAGRYSFWTEPSACREAPRGVLLAGPGVKVQETFYAGTPGIR